MNKNQISVQVEDLNDKKILIFVGDEFEDDFLETVRDHLKRKGIEIGGLMRFPDNHYLTSAPKEEIVKQLKEIIAQLEAQ